MRKIPIGIKNMNIGNIDQPESFTIFSIAKITYSLKPVSCDEVKIWLVALTILPLIKSLPWTWILKIAMGSITKINIPVPNIVFNITLLSFLFFIKNIINRGKNTNKPSDLTIEASAMIANEMYVIFLFELKNRHNVMDIIKI